MDGLDNLGKRIRFSRKKNGLSQEKLAQLLGITTSGVGNYETGKSKPSIEVLVNISNLCNVTVDWLTKGGEEPNFDSDPSSSKPMDNGTFGDDIEKQMMRNVIAELRKDKEYLQNLLNNVTSGKDEVIDILAESLPKVISGSVTPVRYALQ
ncbi:DNA-binding XRE family transcriptional regulator [Catalinimonas alkaloidigena]|uniref:helix-turn-helix domain-containing protein n=1 Tax=Catalinimonas alkaloidigena TaxID=1075417 RepID=UPI002406898C|nr:helix-turn-helix domain-containing protein [Catalinimonas alkaloidigena]MDF9795325.1 DNA-binding XRE family transcriptional regulator [Catalinimonas alkaloidigena]